MNRFTRVLLPAAFGLVGLVTVMRLPLASGLVRIHADEGDARHLNYVLEHVHRWSTGQGAHPDLWSPPMFHPVANTGAYSELLLGVVPLYSPFRLAGLPPDVAVQLFVFAALTLTYVSGYLLFRHGFGAGRLGASTASYLFAFGAFRAQKLGHQHLLAHFFTALALLALVKALRDPGPGSKDRRSLWVLAFFACFVGQVYAGIYLAWFLGLALSLAAVIALAERSTRSPLLDFLRQRSVPLAAGTVAAALALVPLAIPYARAAREVGFRDYGTVAGFLFPLKAWLNPGVFSTLYGGWLGSWSVIQNLPFSWEKVLFPGVVTAALVVLGLRHSWKRPDVRIAALTGGTLLLLATSWPGGHSLWHLVYDFVPGARAIRAVGRLALLLLIPAGIALALAVDRLAARRSAVLVSAVLLAAWAEQLASLPSYDLRPVRSRVARVAAAIPRSCPAFFYAPVLSAEPPWVTQLDAMWASMETGIPTVNGYSSNLPPSWEPLWQHSEAAPGEPRIVAALQAWERTSGLGPGSVCLVQLSAPQPSEPAPRPVGGTPR